MVKPPVKRNAIKSSKAGIDPVVMQRFVDDNNGEARATAPTVRNVRAGSVDVEARTLSAIAVTGTSRTICIYSEDLDTWLDVEELIDVAGMDLSRVETGMQFLDNHNSWQREAILGVVTAANLEDIPDVGEGIVVDVLISSRADLDSVVQDLADGILGCISCQYTVDESELEIRDGMLPLLTVTKSTLLEVSLVSVPADPNSLVRSEGNETMATKPNVAARAAATAAKRAAAARALKRAEGDAAVPTAEELEAQITEIVEQVVNDTVDAVVAEAEDQSRAEGDDAEKTPEEKATDAEAAAAKAKEDEENPVRSMVRSALAKRGMLGTRSAPTPAKPDLTQLRAMADKYQVRGQFDDMAALGTPETELRSFIVNATASRSGTGPTHDGRDTSQRSGNSQLLSWADTNKGKRAADRASKR